jgi:hypothetical protein
MIPTNYKTKQEYQKYVDEYMANLDFQISNDQNNFQQNELYAKTGQQITELADTRSLDQKMIDTTRLITEVRALLTTLTDPTNVNYIIEYLENNDRYLRFVSQSWASIFQYMKANYGIGVQAQIFIGYIKKLYTERSGELSGGTTPDYIFNPRAIQLTVDFLNQLKSMKKQLKSAEQRKLYKNVIDDLNERIKRMRELEREANETFGMMGEDFNINDLERANEAYETEQMGNEDINVAKSTVDRLIEKWINIVNDQMIPEINTAEDIEQVLYKYWAMTKREKDVSIDIIVNLTKSVMMAGEREIQRIKDQEKVERGDMGKEDTKDDAFKIFSSQVGKDFLYAKDIQELEDIYFRIYDSLLNDTTSGKFKTRQESDKYFRELSKLKFEELKRRRQGKRATGSGLARAPAKQRVKVDGRTTKPILYIPFGRYIINRADLGKGILKMRTAKGAVISKFPTEAISRELCSILGAVAQNGTPSLDDINALSDDDKNILHKIIKESHINLPVPDLKLDKSETEYRRFMLLKGMLLAGNNNPQAILELKRLIIKLTASGRLPKAQSNASLQELAQLDL